LHSIDINVKGDRICKPALAQETQYENENFESQENANDSQDQPMPNVHGVQRNTKVMDLSQENMMLLLSNSHQPLMVNLPISPTTLAPGNTTIKRNELIFFLLSLILQTKTTIFLWRKWKR
jgi:hypothetical protein